MHSLSKALEWMELSLERAMIRDLEAGIIKVFCGMAHWGEGMRCDCGHIDFFIPIPHRIHKNK
jgi:hypothetical protein